MRKMEREVKIKGIEISKKEMQEILQAAFEAPVPTKKEAFLRIHTQGISNKEFLLIQATYIRKTTWCVSFTLFVAAFVGAMLLDQNMLWVLAAMIPFLATSAVSENIRSQTFGMAEMEMASRFSLKSVMFARMGILGITHFLLMLVLVLLGHRGGLYSLLETGVYLMVPYLLTTFGGLWINRKIHGKESSYACMGMAAMVSVLQIILGYMHNLIYRADVFQWWILGFFLLISLTIKEMKNMLMRAEAID